MDKEIALATIKNPNTPAATFYKIIDACTEENSDILMAIAKHNRYPYMAHKLISLYPSHEILLALANNQKTVGQVFHRILDKDNSKDIRLAIIQNPSAPPIVITRASKG